MRKLTTIRVVVAQDARGREVFLTGLNQRCMISPRIVTRSFCAVLVLVVLFGGPARGAAPSILVAAASDLQTVMPTLAAQFLTASGSEVRMTYGSSGNFFTQIQNGA